jgi:uncharacterized caspase-like protein
LLFGLLISLVAITPAAAGKRVALVIGNSAYVNATPLANPKNDANDMAAKLRELGFDVILGVDLDKRSFDAKVREFSIALDSAEAALLFYAGHGLQIASQNFLVPVDAKLERERDVEFEAVRLDFILKQMELNRESNTNVVILDACRNNPLTRNLARSMGTRAASIGSGLAEISAGVGTFISYSTQPGNVALDGTGRNSPFAEALLKRVAERDKSLTSVMIEVRNDVVSATGGQQVPWDHSALTGDFYFDPNSKGADSAVLKDRVRELEDTLKTRTNAATEATLVQLRQRHAQMGEETRRDWERVFQLQRDKMAESDPMKLGSMVQEIGRLQIGIVKRTKDQAELKTQIDRLETPAAAPATPAPSQAPAVTPANVTAPAPAAGEAQPDTPPATGATNPSAAPSATGAIPTAAPQEPATPPAKRKKPQRSIDPDWNTNPLGP